MAGARETKKQTRGKRLHTRNRHLRNHRVFSVALSNGLSGAFSHIILLFSGIVQRIVTCRVDVHWNSPMDFQWRFPMDFHLCDFWCVTFCPELSKSGVWPGSGPLPAAHRHHLVGGGPDLVLELLPDVAIL